MRGTVLGIKRHEISGTAPMENLTREQILHRILLVGPDAEFFEGHMHKSALIAARIERGGDDFPGLRHLQRIRAV